MRNGYFATSSTQLRWLLLCKQRQSISRLWLTAGACMRASDNLSRETLLPGTGSAS